MPMTSASHKPSRSTGDSLHPVAVSRFPSKYGLFEAHAFADGAGCEHLALVYGEPPSSALAPLVRIHSECITGEVFGSARCECAAQLEQALVIAGCRARHSDRQHRARPSGGYSQLRRRGCDPCKLGISRVRLLTNNLDKVSAVEAGGISVDSRVPLLVEVSLGNRDYLETKAEKLGHLLA
jgi:GTP cyclohydrolase II